MESKRQGLELSAFFVGILYFIVQWVWQMQNSKQGVAMPYAYALMVGVSLTGMFSLHSLLVDGQFPNLGLRLANAVLFGIFAAIAVLTFDSAKATLLEADSSIARRWLFAESWAVATVGALICLMSYGLAKVVQRVSRSAQTRRDVEEAQ